MAALSKIELYRGFGPQSLSFALMPARLMSAVVLGAIAVLSVLPEPWKSRTATHGRIHDCAHILAFLIAFLLVTRKLRYPTRVVLAAILLLLFGAFLEFLQTRLYGNPFEYKDLVTNAAGLIIGLVVLNLR